MLEIIYEDLINSQLAKLLPPIRDTRLTEQVLHIFLGKIFYKTIIICNEIPGQ